MTSPRGIPRRTALGIGAAVMLPLRIAPAWAADIVVKVGVDLPLTGANTIGAQRILNAILMAFDEANQNQTIPGYRIKAVVYDDATSTAGQSDPAQAATNARKMVSDKEVVAALGPQISGAGKAMAPILSMGNLATITPSATNPDITNPKFVAQYRPAGKLIFFRTCTTDAYQGPSFANFCADTLKAKSVFVLDDAGAYGVGLCDSFQAQSEKKGLAVLGRDRVDPLATNYTPVLTKIKQLGPDALFFGGLPLAGVKVAKQAYDIIREVIKGSGDGMFSVDFLKAASFPAAEGWYVTSAAPHLAEDSRAAELLQRYKERFGVSATDYAITAFDATLVILDSIKRVAANGGPVTRDTVRDAIEVAKVETIQGPVSFDENGDINDHTISIFQIRRDDSKPLDDVRSQYKYLGAAPQA